MVMPALPGTFNQINSILGRYDNTETDVENIIRFAALRTTDAILDVPCGFGRVSGCLHLLGFSVSGIDLSEEQIDLAQVQNPGPTYSVADMRDVRPDTYNAILNIYSSFGYMHSVDEDFECLRSWFNGLKEGGRLVMEVCDLARSREIDQLEQHLLNEEGKYIRVTGPATEVIHVDYSTNILSVDYCMSGNVVKTKTRLYEQEHLVELLMQAGFSDAKCFGGFDGIPKSLNTGLVILATK